MWLLKCFNLWGFNFLSLTKKQEMVVRKSNIFAQYTQITDYHKSSARTNCLSGMGNVLAAT